LPAAGLGSISRDQRIRRKLGSTYWQNSIAEVFPLGLEFLGSDLPGDTIGWKRFKARLALVPAKNMIFGFEQGLSYIWFIVWAELISTPEISFVKGINPSSWIARPCSIPKRLCLKKSKPGKKACFVPACCPRKQGQQRM
jgi:hypothetical protein